MDITVRKAIKDDIEKILTVQKKAFLFQANKYNDHDMPPMQETYEGVLDDLNKHLIFVAIVNSGIVGSVRIIKSNDEAEIKRLSVDDDYHDNGIGQMLIKVSEMQYPELKRIWLLTGSKSYKSIALYKKLGYELYKEENHKDYKLVYLQKQL